MDSWTGTAGATGVQYRIRVPWTVHGGHVHDRKKSLAPRRGSENSWVTRCSTEMVTSWSSSPSSPTSYGTTVAGPPWTSSPAGAGHPTTCRQRSGDAAASPHLVARAVQYGVLRDGQLPRAYYERLGEAGIDFAVLYPTMGIALLQILDDEARTTLCRLYNEFMADQYRAYGDRFTVAALIPMNSPEEAIGALEHAKGLGSKVGLIASHVHRGVPGQTWPPDDDWAALRIAEWEVYGWIDTFGIDSAYDYDPVWAKAVELKMPLAAHTAGIGFSDRASVTNFVFNQIGHFAASGAALAKSLFLGGVTRRFPD